MEIHFIGTPGLPWHPASLDSLESLDWFVASVASGEEHQCLSVGAELLEASPDRRGKATAGSAPDLFEVHK